MMYLMFINKHEAEVLKEKWNEKCEWEDKSVWGETFFIATIFLNSET